MSLCIHQCHTLKFADDQTLDLLSDCDHHKADIAPFFTWSTESDCIFVWHFNLKKFVHLSFKHKFNTRLVPCYSSR